MASAVAPPVTAKTTLSVDPLYAAAVAQAKAALAAQTAPITAEQTASDAGFQQRETDATGVAAALQKLLTPIGPAVNGEYQTAAQNQELAANGFSHGMQDALQGNTDNLNAMLAKLGSPATLDSHAGQAGDVLYGLGGYNPGTTFSKAGAAFGAAADLQAGDAVLRGQDNVAQLRGQAIVADKEFQNKIAELAGKLPGDIQANYQHLQTLALSNAKFREQVAKDKSDAAFKTAAAKLAAAKYNTGIDEFNAKQKLAYTKLARQQFQQDRSYALSLQRLGIARTSLQLRIAANAFKAAHGGYTQKDITKFAEQANAMANSALHGSQSSMTTYDASGKVVKSGSRVTGSGTPYFQALGGMLKRGIPVQVALSALDRVYPQSAQPTAEALLRNLGRLAPQSVLSTINQRVIGETNGASVLGGNSLSVLTHAGGFLPTNVPFTAQRADQGRDIQTAPGAPIIAPGDGYVVRIASDPGSGGVHFGPRYPIVHFTSGPYAGKTMYIGHTVAALQAGQKFSAGAPISHTQQSGPMNGGAPPGWAEIGFAPNGTPGANGQAPPF